jgi:hypothetical protein
MEDSLACTEPLRKEDRCSAAEKNAESRQPASRYAERSARYPASILGLKQNGLFTLQCSPACYERRFNTATANLYKRSFLMCSSGTPSFPDRLRYAKDDKYLL